MKPIYRIAAFIVIPLCIAGAVLLYNYHSTSRTGPEGEARPAAAQRGGGAPRKIPVDVHVVDYVKISEGIRALGTLIANEEVDIASEVSGKIEKIFFEEGSHIRGGQALVKVNDDDLQSQLKRATFQRNLLREKLDRARILLDKDAISREAFDQIETDYNVIEADIQLLEVRIDKTSIKAPFDGVVGFRYVSPGSYIQPGTKIAHIVDNKRLKIEFSIPEKYYGADLNGSYIHFTTEADQRPRSARIYAVDPTVDVTTRTVIMRAMYDNEGLRIIPGMFANVTVGQKDGNTLQVPTEAIVPDADQKKVWVVQDGHAHMQAVVTGTRSETMVEITRGLLKGDSVVVTGLMQVKEGAPLLINN